MHSKKTKQKGEQMFYTNKDIFGWWPPLSPSLSLTSLNGQIEIEPCGV